MHCRKIGLVTAGTLGKPWDAGWIAFFVSRLYVICTILDFRQLVAAIDAFYLSCPNAHIFPPCPRAVQDLEFRDCDYSPCAAADDDDDDHPGGHAPWMVQVCVHHLPTSVQAPTVA